MYSPNSDGFYIFHISQGSVATQLRCRGMFSNHFITNFPQNAPVKNFWESANISQRYGQNFVAYFFGGHPVHCCSIAVEVARQLSRSKKTHIASAVSDSRQSLPPLVRWYTIPTGQDRNQCSVCGMLFNRATTLSMHMHRHTSTYRHRCASCRKRFRAKHNLLRHLACHMQSSAAVASPVAAAVSQGTGSVASDRQTDGGGLYLCTMCNETLPTSDTLVSHQLQHAWDVAIYCPHCDKPFTNSHDHNRHRAGCLRSHERRHPRV